MNENLIWRCLGCGIILEDNDNICPECGGEDYIAGSIMNTEGKWNCCICGDTKGRMTAHMDMTDRYSTTYACECGNSIVVDMKRDEDDMSYWR